MDSYQVIRTLGQGSYGTVLKCKHIKSGTTVAVKCFRNESLKDRDTEKSAGRELKALQMLRHDNILRLYDSFMFRGRLHMVCQFIDSTLLREIERSVIGMHPTQVKNYMWQTVKAVKHMHDNGLIHRDIKPENVLITRQGVVKLCDFGFTKAQGPHMSNYVSTRWYRATELVLGSTAYDKSVDIWAIGCLIPECLTGEAMFPGDSELDMLVMIQKCLGSLSNQQVQAFKLNPQFRGASLPQVYSSQFSSKYSRKLDMTTMAITLKCLAYSPSNRPSAAELLSHQYFTNGNWHRKYDAELELLTLQEGMNEASISATWVKKTNFPYKIPQRRESDESFVSN